MKNLLIGFLVGVCAAGVLTAQAERFELEGNMKFFGTGNGIIFPDGTKQISATGALRPDPPCFDLTNRYVNCGQGTVTDTLTGLIWLQNAFCPDLGNPTTWRTANQTAALLKGWGMRAVGRFAAGGLAATDAGGVARNDSGSEGLRLHGTR